MNFMNGSVPEFMDLVEAIENKEHRSESEKHSREKFKALISRYLDSLDIDDKLRERATKYAAGQAIESEILRPESVDSNELVENQKILRQVANAVDEGPWLDVVKNQWPSPIAHEIDILIALMQRPDDRPIMPDTVMYQYRDAFEVLIKFTASVLLCTLISMGGKHANWARLSLRNKLSTGSWVGLLRDAARRLGDVPEEVPVEIKNLGLLAKDCIYPAADVFSQIRNEQIGHGARVLDLKETTDTVIGCLAKGEFTAAGGTTTKCKAFFPMLEELVQGNLFSGFHLRLAQEDKSEDLSLTGVDATRQWMHKHEHQYDLGNTTTPLLADLESGESIALSPLVAARQCKRCLRQDVLLYDSAAIKGESAKKFDVMDYARGHRSKLGADSASDLVKLFAGLDPYVEQEAAVDHRAMRRADQSVIEALDSARLDRNYVSPAYLRDSLAEYLNNNSKGVYWLQAPAHIGKTTFALGLLPNSELNEDPIVARFASQPVCIFHYMIRREIRSGVLMFMNTLERQFYDYKLVSDTNRHKAPSIEEVIKDPSPISFVNWINEWRQFIIKERYLAPDHPFLFVIDGLDEAEPPGLGTDKEASPVELVPDEEELPKHIKEASPIELLPNEEQLPEHVYFVLTSRVPDGTDEVPDYLSSYLVPRLAPSA